MRHEFRHVTDRLFVHQGLFAELESGILVQHLQGNDIELLLGECKFTHFAFVTWHTPMEKSLETVKRRLSVDYPPRIIDTLLSKFYSPAGELPYFNGHRCRNWYEFFGMLYAAIEVHVIQRGFINKLFAQDAGNCVRRCSISWQAKKADKNFPKEMKATHGTDTALWFFGEGVGLKLLKKEEATIEAWCRPYWSRIRGDGWTDEWKATESPDVLRYINADGKTETEKDNRKDWERGVQVWKMVRKPQRE